MAMSKSEAGRLGYAVSSKTIAANNLKRLEKYLENPSRCVHCNACLSYRKRGHKFCSHSCSAKHNNRGVRRHHNALRALKPCVECGELTRNTSCCSRGCFQKSRAAKRSALIISSGRFHGKRSARNFIKSSVGDQCNLCGISDWMGEPLVMVMDHVNGNPEDWSIGNMRLICPNCDSQTPTFKGRNKGNGRYSRRMRYRSGKSH